MATEVDVLSKALADLNVAATREFTLKPEQEVAVRALLHGKDVLAVADRIWQKHDIPNVCPRQGLSNEWQRFLLFLRWLVL